MYSKHVFINSLSSLIIIVKKLQIIDVCYSTRHGKNSVKQKKNFRNETDAKKNLNFFLNVLVYSFSTLPNYA